MAAKSRILTSINKAVHNILQPLLCLEMLLMAFAKNG